MRWLPALLLLGACADFATPAELSKPTVLAVIADPPLVPPGHESALSVIVAGPDGPMAPDATSWKMIETLPGIPAFGEVDAGPTGSALFKAPDPVPTQPDGAPPLASVQVEVTLGDETVDVVKAMLVIDMPSANPALASMTIDGADATDGMTLTEGDSHDLAVAIDPAADDKTTYAWYSTAGTIDYYQSNPTQLVADQGAGDKWLFAVVRDGRGGVAWRGVHLTVQ